MVTINPPKNQINKASLTKNKNNGKEVKTVFSTSKPSPTETVNLNLAVSNSLKIDYKTFCVQQGKNMNEIFEEMYDEYKSKF